MKQKVLALLQCPYCETDLNEVSLADTSMNSTQFGIFKCECDEYPLIEGVLYLKKNEAQINRRAVELLKAKKYHRAFRLVLEERKKVKWLYMLLQKYSKPGKSFFSFSHFIAGLKFFLPESLDWFRYLQSRQKRVTFLLSLGNLMYCSNQGIFLDVGCGMGHFLQKATSLLPKSEFIGIDNSFSFLFLARKYFLPGKVALICSDVNVGLPIKTLSVTSLFVNDAFMYIQRKKFFIQEVKRTLQKIGLGVFSHIHHSQGQNLGQGYAVTAHELNNITVGLTREIAADARLFSHLLLKAQGAYQKMPEKIIEKNFTPSFSFVLKKNKMKLKENSQVKEKVLDIIINTTIDFSEEEYLKKKVSHK